ncbi:MAG: glucosamine-6-phosphate deaminase [Calditrichia bacterium]|nr:glucosamine-6-phosphate deaminase [Calditrichia bacterium]MCK5454644.1 glucosamine-6-phosphate deaminase [Calditrichia bacterium]
MLLIIRDDYEQICHAAAEKFAYLIRKKPNCILGLATGSTPLGVYRELVKIHKEENLDFSLVQTFNLDEYVGLPREHEQSYFNFMKTNLFDHVNIHPNSIHIPDGMASDIEQECIAYEQKIIEAGGIDLQILGIGSNGHIAFNEPFSSLGSRTRIKTLTEKTRKDNTRFFDTMDEVPKYAITMGVGTIMDSKSIILLAIGKNKAWAIRTTVEGPITALVPATMVQMHRDATLMIDREAATELTQAINIAE